MITRLLYSHYSPAAGGWCEDAGEPVLGVRPPVAGHRATSCSDHAPDTGHGAWHHQSPAGVTMALYCVCRNKQMIDLFVNNSELQQRHKD